MESYCVVHNNNIPVPSNVTEKFEAWLATQSHRRECELVLWVLGAQAALMVVAVVLLQLWVALRVLGYGEVLARRECVESGDEGDGEEKYEV